MEPPLKGIRVLEVANWLAIPSCGAMMADMGANVIKVEALQGDTFRTEIRDADFGTPFPISYAFEMDNRGKRSMALDLSRPKAQEAVQKLAARSDVFTTNLIPRRQEAFHLTYEELSKDTPELIYLSFNGYGANGPDKDRTGFDYTAFWTRSGAMSLFSRPGEDPVNLRSGFGDHTSSPALLAGVMTALWVREKTGKGQKVSTSLLNMGLWVVGGDLSRSLYARQQPFQWKREQSPNPLQNTYQTRDGRWINVVSPNTNEKWAGFCRAIGRDDLITDEKSADPLARRHNALELIPDLDKTLARFTLAELTPRLDAQGVIWAPMQDLMDSMYDPQVRANDFIVTVDHPTHGPYETLATPLKFSESEVKARGRSPRNGPAHRTGPGRRPRLLLGRNRIPPPGRRHQLTPATHPLPSGEGDAPIPSPQPVIPSTVGVPLVGTLPLRHSRVVGNPSRGVGQSVQSPLPRWERARVRVIPSPAPRPHDSSSRLRMSELEPPQDPP